MRKEQSGPPDPEKYPPRPLQGREDEERSAPLRDLGPLILAQLADLVTTGALVGKKYPGHRRGVEANPLPGMESNVGRAGWGLAETLMLHYLSKDKPKLREAIKGTLPGVHGVLALNNAGLRQGTPLQESRKGR